METHLFRIAQEAVSNSLKHGEAKRVDLSLHFGPDRVTLTVRDDGKGLSREKLIQKARDSHSYTTQDFGQNSFDVISFPDKGEGTPDAMYIHQFSGTNTESADILLYKPYGAPVGKDQAPHLEIRPARA